MPYAPYFVDGLQIGDYEIWSFYEKCDEKIKDQEVITNIKKILSRHCRIKMGKKYEEEEIKNIYMISPQNYEFKEPFSEKQREDIFKIRDIISFCSISKSESDQFFFEFSSNHFITHIQNIPGGMTNFDSIVIDDTFSTNEVYIDGVKFFEPLSIIPITENSLSSDIDKNLLESFNKCFNENNCEVIFSVLNLFYYVFYRERIMDLKHKILLLCMCFDVLLNCDGKKKFTKKICKIIQNEVEPIDDEYKPILEKRSIEIDKSKSIKEITLNKTAWWAYDLYELRSNIVHHNKLELDVKKNGNIRTILLFGTILLKEIIIKKLIEKKFFEDTSIYELEFESFCYRRNLKRSLDSKLEIILKIQEEKLSLFGK